MTSSVNFLPVTCYTAVNSREVWEPVVAVSLRCIIIMRVSSYFASVIVYEYIRVYSLIRAQNLCHSLLSSILYQREMGVSCEIIWYSRPHTQYECQWIKSAVSQIFCSISINSIIYYSEEVKCQPVWLASKISDLMTRTFLYFLREINDWLVNAL